MTQANELLIVALTGSIGSGKSEVAQLFEELGAPIVDADILARESVKPGSEALKKIVATFGSEYLTKNGELDRKALAELVFSKPEKRKLLEEIIHPEVRRLFLSTVETFRKKYPDGTNTLIIYVVPLLFESKHPCPEVKKIIVVSAPRDICIQRVVARDGCTMELAAKKYASQIPIEEKEKKAHYVIRNHSDIAALRAQVKRVYGELLKN